LTPDLSKQTGIVRWLVSAKLEAASKDSSTSIKVLKFEINSPDTRLNMRSIGMGKVKLRLASIFNARNPSVDDMSVDKYIHNDCKN
jgi:hypothetical protein